MKGKGKYARLLLAAVFFLGVVLFVVGYFNQKGQGNDNVNYQEEYCRQLEEMLSGIEGIGKMKIMINCNTGGQAGEVSGVAVICQGGNDPRVVKDIIGIVGAVCGVASNRIYVAPMNN